MIFLYIVDTNILLDNPNVVTKYDCVILSHVLRELENFKKSEDELAFKSRQATRALEDADVYCDLKDYNFTLDKHFDPDYVDNKILQCAVDNNYGVITNDLLLKRKCKSYGVEVINIDCAEDDYKGYRILYENDDNLANVYENPTALGLYPNEYLIIRNSQGKTLDIMRWDGKRFDRLRLPPKRIIAPLNDLQKCTLDLLMNKDIPGKIVAGTFGSGKSLLSTLCGLYMVQEKGFYDKLVLVRNNDLADFKDPGSLPGDIFEKTDILFKSMIQHFPMGEAQAEDMRNKGLLETHITYYIKGLSVSGFMIVDEAEDLTVKDIKSVGSRIEEGSCIVFCGDWQQSSGKYKYNNGLLHLLNNTKDNPLFGTCVMDLDVRSNVSKVFAEL